MKKKKVIFIIGSCEKYSTGVGGHYYSLLSVIKALKYNIEVVIINFGPREFISPVFKNFRGLKYFINYKSTFKMLVEINLILDKEKPDILHSYDFYSLFFSQIMSKLYRLPHIHTKAGGINRKFKNINNLIVFSKENELFYRKEYKSLTNRIYFIPNRIFEVKPRNDRIDDLRSILPSESTIFLRISRITKFYEKTFLQSIHLINKLNKEGIKCKLVIIGLINDYNFFKKLKNYENSNVIILTKKKYTLRASEFLGLTDFIIGTGRGLMEACSLGKIVLVPCQKSKIPLLVTSNNFNIAFYYNFSERVLIEDYNEEENYRLICRVINNYDYAKSISDRNRVMAENYFNIRSAISKYMDIYDKIKFKNINSLNLTLSLILFLRFDFFLYLPKKIRNSIFKLWNFFKGNSVLEKI